MNEEEIHPDYAPHGDSPYMGSSKCLFLTGASGLLGRAVRQKFVGNGWHVYGTAFTRVGPELHKVDLTNPIEVKAAFSVARPTFVIHCAAQRFPDKVESNEEAAKQINVEATRTLVELCYKMNVPMLYISTDYVFDGNSAPYSVTAVPTPINLYGHTKLSGEHVTLMSDQKGPENQLGNLVLRIPVLYGPVETLAESAVTMLLGILLDRSQSHTVSDYELRRPSHVDDIAEICFGLVHARSTDTRVRGIFHWCGSEVYTKFGMIGVMAEAFDLPFNHIVPSTVPTGLSNRPYDTTLDISRTLETLGSQNVNFPNFKSHIQESLLPWVERHRAGNQ